MTGSERVPFADKPICGPINGVRIHSPAILSPHYASNHLNNF